MKTVTVVALSALLMATASLGSAKAADADARAHVNEAGAQVQPYRMTVKGEDRMIHTADTNYIRVGTTWQRAPVSPPAAEATPDQATYTDCKVVGREKINGVDTTAYQYTMHLAGMPDPHDKIWIGKTDGLVYRLAPGTGDVEDFDYKNVQAPQV